MQRHVHTYSEVRAVSTLSLLTAILGEGHLSVRSADPPHGTVKSFGAGMIHEGGPLQLYINYSSVNEAHFI